MLFFSANSASSFSRHLIPTGTIFFVISKHLLPAHAWLYLVSSHSSAKSVCASICKTDRFLYSSAAALTQPWVIVCSPPIITGNLLFLIISFTFRYIAFIIDSGSFSAFNSSKVHIPTSEIFLPISSSYHMIPAEFSIVALGPFLVPWLNVVVIS